MASMNHSVTIKWLRKEVQSSLFLLLFDTCHVVAFSVDFLCMWTKSPIPLLAWLLSGYYFPKFLLSIHQSLFLKSRRQRCLHCLLIQGHNINTNVISLGNDWTLRGLIRKRGEHWQRWLNYNKEDNTKENDNSGSRRHQYQGEMVSASTTLGAR